MNANAGMENALNRQLFREYFEGRATPMQKALMEEWLRESGHQELYFKWLEEWEREHPQFLADTDGAYLRSLERLRPPLVTGEPADHAAQQNQHIPFRHFWWVAASFLLLTMGWLGRDYLLYQSYATQFGEVKSLTLADGSQVVMNANSELKVPRLGFGTDTREVWLSGEAEFSVRHTSDHRRFVVRTGDGLEVEVLGTEFVVFSRPRGSRVALHQGRVELRTLKDPARKPVLVLPGDVVTISTQGELAHYHQQPVREESAWKDHQFVFNNTSLKEIKQQVAEQFGITIQWSDPDLSSRTIGGTFKITRAEDLLEVLAEMLDARLRQENARTYTLITTK